MNYTPVTVTIHHGKCNKTKGKGGESVNALSWKILRQKSA